MSIFYNRIVYYRSGKRAAVFQGEAVDAHLPAVGDVIILGAIGGKVTARLFDADLRTINIYLIRTNKKR